MSPDGYRGRPSESPNRKEVIFLRIELQSGAGWQAVQVLSRIGDRVFIPDAMPELEYQSGRVDAGLMQNWWLPTPVPVNN